MNRLIKTILLSTLILSSQAFAAISSGTITVTGRVINTPCVLSQVNHSIRFDCQNENKTFSKTINIENKNRQYNINNNSQVVVNTNYINKEKTLAIVNVMYN